MEGKTVEQWEVIVFNTNYSAMSSGEKAILDAFGKVGTQWRARLIKTFPEVFRRVESLYTPKLLRMHCCKCRKVKNVPENEWNSDLRCDCGGALEF